MDRWGIYYTPKPFVQIECLIGRAKKKWNKGFWLILHTTVWVIWSTRNRKIFKNRDFEVDAKVEEIKVLLWKRSLSRLKASPCTFYEWKWCTGDCFAMWEVGIAVHGSFSALFWGCWAVYVAVDRRVLGVTKYWVVVLMCFPLFWRGSGVCFLSLFVALFRRCSRGSLLFVVPASV